MSDKPITLIAANAARKIMDAIPGGASLNDVARVIDDACIDFMRAVADAADRTYMEAVGELVKSEPVKARTIPAFAGCEHGMSWYDTCALCRDKSKRLREQP